MVCSEAPQSEAHPHTDPNRPPRLPGFRRESPEAGVGAASMACPRALHTVRSGAISRAERPQGLKSPAPRPAQPP